MALRALLFDLDGTVVDSMALTYDAIRRAARPYLGRHVLDEEVDALLGPPEPVIMAGLVGPHLASACTARYERLYLARLKKIAPFVGIRELLRHCQVSGLKLGVITGRGRRLALLTLAALGLGEVFDLVVGGDDVVRPKPDPEGVRLALWQLGLRPSEALVVGDSPLDVRAGRAARVATAGALWGARDASVLGASKPRFLCEAPADLRVVVDALKAPLQPALRPRPNRGGRATRVMAARPR